VCNAAYACRLHPVAVQRCCLHFFFAYCAHSHDVNPATGESVPQMKEALTHAAAPASTTGTTSPASVPSDAAEGVDLSNLSANKSDKSEASNAPAGSDKLDMNGLNRVNVLFSGCSFVTVDGMCDKTKPGKTLLLIVCYFRLASVRACVVLWPCKMDLWQSESVIKTSLPRLLPLLTTASSCIVSAATASGIPTAPDGGALAYVLRTGFGSSQGSLLQMIEFSQQTVAGGTLVVVLFSSSSARNCNTCVAHA
jgi:magnesium-transporting ATPase (P-type)